MNSERAGPRKVLSSFPLVTRRTHEICQVEEDAAHELIVFRSFSRLEFCGAQAVVSSSKTIRIGISRHVPDRKVVKRLGGAAIIVRSLRASR